MKSLFLAAFCAAPIAAAPLTALSAPVCSRQSPAHTVALLELYTSEGCSSCPPADRFVSGLKTNMASDQVVPLSLHVDYWNYIGWKDEYSRRAFTERQRWLADQVGSRTVYTPEIFIAGRENRNWYDSSYRNLQDIVKRINARPAQADIGIAYGKPVDGKLPVEVRAKVKAKADSEAARASTLFLALYQNGIQTEVKAGENGGATLKHDYVVREFLGPIAVPAGDGATVTRSVQLPVNAPLKNLGIAAFVQGDRGDILQALSLPLCE